jgi:hypothetical protein
MKPKIKYIIIFTFVFLLSFASKNNAQEEMDFEEFMGMLSQSLTENQLDEISYQIPWNVTVYSYGYGDFSGDYIDDFVVAIKEKDVTPNKSVDVYFLECTKDSYKLVKKKNYKWIEIPLEVAFLVKDGLCYVTSRDEHNWYFTGYKIESDQIVQTNKQTFQIDSEKAGK